MAALDLRKDRTPTVLRKLAKTETDSRVARRMLAIANALDGMSRAEAVPPVSDPYPLLLLPSLGTWSS